MVIVIRQVNRGEHGRPCGDCVLVLRDLQEVGKW